MFPIYEELESISASLSHARAVLEPLRDLKLTFEYKEHVFRLALDAIGDCRLSLLKIAQDARAEEEEAQ